MKSLTILLALTFSVMFSSTGFAGWTKVGEDWEFRDGTTYYVDFERITKHERYVYWWKLTDLLKSTTTGVLSYKSYNQGDCRFNQTRSLSVSIHKEPMGRGIGIEGPTLQWNLVRPDSLTHTYLKSVCAYAK
jgi:hypothetical protein